jgi:phosphatidylglycerophosphate synthase
MGVLGLLVVVGSALDWPFGLVSQSIVALAAVAWAVGWMTRLYWSVSHHTTADRVTMLRLGFGAGAMLLLIAAELLGPLDSADPAYRVVFIAFLSVAVVSDFFDGQVARRTSTSRFGEDWDMQNDAAFAMLLSIAAVVFVGVDSWVILIGLARYLFVLAVPGAHESVHTPRSYELYGKVVCALTVVSLAAVVADGESGVAASIALGISLVAVLSSFGWFTLLLRRDRGSYFGPRTHASERVRTLD